MSRSVAAIHPRARPPPLRRRPRPAPMPQPKVSLMSVRPVTPAGSFLKKPPGKPDRRQPHDAFPEEVPTRSRWRGRSPMRGHSDRVVGVRGLYRPGSNGIVIVYVRPRLGPWADAAFGRGDPTRHISEGFRGTHRTHVRVVYLLAVQAESCRPQLHGSSLDRPSRVRGSRPAPVPYNSRRAIRASWTRRVQPALAGTLRNGGARLLCGT